MIAVAVCLWIEVITNYFSISFCSFDGHHDKQERRINAEVCQTITKQLF